MWNWCWCKKLGINEHWRCFPRWFCVVLRKLRYFLSKMIRKTTGWTFELWDDCKKNCERSKTFGAEWPTNIPYISLYMHQASNSTKFELLVLPDDGCDDNDFSGYSDSPYLLLWNAIFKNISNSSPSPSSKAFFCILLHFFQLLKERSVFHDWTMKTDVIGYAEFESSIRFFLSLLDFELTSKIEHFDGAQCLKGGTC